MSQDAIAASEQLGAMGTFPRGLRLMRLRHSLQYPHQESAVIPLHPLHAQSSPELSGDEVDVKWMSGAWPTGEERPDQLRASSELIDIKWFGWESPGWPQMAREL